MILRQLKQTEYDLFTQALFETAHAQPLEASYTVYMVVNGVEYAVKLQPERHCKIAVLQAYRIEREAEGPLFELITNGALLTSFLELLIYQGPMAAR